MNALKWLTTREV